ncbi:MAG: phosphonate metabolism protein/1,5-bisphosphokinase (PRPP-forming) PhnN [Pseudomonadota bacterium]
MSTGGVLFLVVGPSGVGKDTLIDAAREAFAGEPDFAFAKRAITRPAGAGGEDHEAITEPAFRAAEAGGSFMATWRAHGLCYGIRRTVLDQLAAGRNVIVNGSRREVKAFETAAERLVVLSITAPPEVVKARLKARGREDASAVAERLAREAPIKAAARVIEVVNDGGVEEGAARFISAILGAAHLPLKVAPAPFAIAQETLALIHEGALAVKAGQLEGAGAVDVVAGARAVRARLALSADAHVVERATIALSPSAIARLGVVEGDQVTVRRARAAASRDVLRKKVAGEALTALEIEEVVRDVVDGRYTESEVAGFLVAASQNLSLDEVVALTKVRAAMGTPLRWDAPLVADKHSMGGVPGSRITLIAVPIVAAHGLIVPKTSSRAITSAAGTADVMECVAKVDLTPDDLKRTVAAAGAAIAWNGKISHSPLDDVMNKINRPLGIKSASLDVSSILSKKLLAGATHVIVDIPVGEGAKLQSVSDGRRLAALFEAVGRGVGLHVTAQVTDGSEPIGGAVGPALEWREVDAVLSATPQASSALRDKALDFAGKMLSWDKDVPPGMGRQRAQTLLESGAALETFQAVVEAQGRRAPARPGLFERTINAPKAGTVSRINGFAVAGLARAAGAPFDKGAGARLLVDPGARVSAGAPILSVLASTQEGLDRTDGINTEDLVTLR